jgi:hypothetical protein
MFTTPVVVQNRTSWISSGPSRKVSLCQRRLWGAFSGSPKFIELKVCLSYWPKLPPVEIRSVILPRQVVRSSVVVSRTGGSVGGWSGFNPQNGSEDVGTARSGSLVRPSAVEESDDPRSWRGGGAISVEVPRTRALSPTTSIPWELAVFGSVAAASALRDRTRQAARRAIVREEQIAVARVLIALRGSARDFVRRSLRDLAAKADTTQPQGLLRLLSDATLVLERARELDEGWYATAHDIVAFDASEAADAERSFRQMSMHVKGTWREDTVLNLDGVRRFRPLDDERSRASSQNAGASSSLMVVTVLVAAQGLQGQVRSTSDALSCLHAVPEGKLLAVEILWTPDREDDTLSEEEMIAQFPELVRTSLHR